MAQIKNYSERWKKVDQLQQKGLTGSARTEVLSIMKLAVQERQDAEQIKCAMYLMQLRDKREEDSEEKNIAYADTLIASAQPPAKQILLSMQAEMNWDYFQRNRWKLYNRKQAAKEDDRDIGTWSIAKIHRVIGERYRASLENEPLLRHTPVGRYEPILVAGKNTRNLRPTLFDLLAHRALEYFGSDERDLIRPADAFTLNDPQVFAPADAFARRRFQTADTNNLHYTALQLYQRLLAFHHSDAKPDALIDADLLRLRFVYQYCVLPEKEQLYEQALQKLSNDYVTHPASAQADWMRAVLLYERGSSYHHLNAPAHADAWRLAVGICTNAIQRHPGSEGAINCSNLLQQIRTPELSLISEKVNLPGKPFRSLLKYRNASRIFLRVVPVTHQQLKTLNREPAEKRWQAYASIKPLSAWSLDPPDPHDYRMHSTEIKIDALAPGTYLILASLNEGFTGTENIMARQLVYVSNISYVKADEGMYYALHRESGKPLNGISVQVWETAYDYTTRNYEETAREKITTGSDGSFRIKASDNRRNYALQLRSGDDELYMNDEWLSDFYAGPEMPAAQTSAFLFTDRSIYRPGQLVYFKGIVLRREPEASQTRVLSGFSTTVVLRDANERPLAELRLKTNDYGSYQGTFRLPEGLLNGYFTITDSAGNGRTDIRVEEYKRPRFFVELSKPAGSFRVNDTVIVPGNAAAYAGNKLSGAQVTYRVVRRMRYPVWWDYGGAYVRRKGMPFGRQQETEIASGTTRTNEQGGFEITFAALPDLLVDKNEQPVFYYEVSTDVTDINGETRSGEITVAAGYQLLQLEFRTPERLSADSFNRVLLSATNLNGTDESVAATVSIQALKSPDRIYRERYWEQPDQFMISPEAYTRDFPFDVYRNENEVRNFPVSAEVKQLSGMTGNDAAFSLNGLRLTRGWYKLIATAKDRNGEAVKAERYVYVTDNGVSDPLQPITLRFTEDGKLPGQKLSSTVGSGFDRVWLLSSLRRMRGAKQYGIRELAAGTAWNNDLLLEESDRGGVELAVILVRNNRFYSLQENKAIPWSNKELNISIETFRNKMLPGADETLTLKLSGSKSEQVAAELLATMYDASLDQFRPQAWQRPDIWPMLQPRLAWIRYGFGDVGSEQLSMRSEGVIEAPEKTYDRLLDIFTASGGMLEYGGVYRKDKLSGRPVSAAAPMLADAADGGIANTASVAVADSSGGGAGKPPASSGQTGNPSGMRSDFSETVFFYPQLNTAADGSIAISFRMPEAVTQWKLMLFAHTAPMASAKLEQTTVTAKPLMVQANPPRFLREGDLIYIGARLVNLSEQTVSGIASLELLDAVTREPLHLLKGSTGEPRQFSLKAGKQAAVDFRVRVPDNFTGPLICRIRAVSSVYTDGEETVLPVLPKTILLTASLPITPEPGKLRSYRFEELLQTATAATSAPKNHALVVEYAANPTWLVVQALPWLMEQRNESVEELFNRYFANALAGHIVRQQPRIAGVFEQWRTTDTSALQSNLQKNAELKSVLLQETPWVMDAMNESKQKMQLAHLFDAGTLKASNQSALGKLRDMQAPTGGFFWFKGAPEDRYMTQYILAGIGQLQQAGAVSPEDAALLEQMVEKALAYVDRALAEDYRKRNAATRKKGIPCGPHELQYLYMRSFFNKYLMPAATKKAASFYTAEAKKSRYRQSVYLQGMTALVLQRSGDTKTAQEMIRSLRQNAIIKPDYGMYWKSLSSTSAYYWHQAPIEAQALLIAAFTEVEGGADAVDDLRYWLLRQKQTQRWPTTRSTAAACYALLMRGSDWMGAGQPVDIRLGGKSIRSDDALLEAGTGYFKKRIPASEITADMGYISIEQPGGAGTVSKGGWGAVYWQYFQNLESIRALGEPLKVDKQLYREKASREGPVLEPLGSGTAVSVGDKIQVRLTIRSDRDLEYVHMKDLRAACMEPVNVLSDYRYQGGLGYYETTRDASTQFFFHRLPRGTYVFDYPLFVAQAGYFNSGICTLECLYAPEFSAHSGGQTFKVDPGR